MFVALSLYRDLITSVVFELLPYFDIPDVTNPFKYHVYKCRCVSHVTNYYLISSKIGTPNHTAGSQS
jgi:hypothetical protein